MSHKSAFDHLSENSSNIFLAQYARLLSKNPAVAQTIRRLPFAGIDQAIGPMRHTYRLPSVARKIFASVPLKILREYLASYLLHNMAKFDERFTASGIPEVFSELFLEHYRRIAGEIEAAQGPDDPASDRFAKELALARLRLIPAVAQLILPDSGIGLRTLAKIGLAHSLRLMSLTKGRRPFFEIHTHDATAGGNFNPEGWDRTYALAAELLRSQPDCRGLMGSSWFYDPALKQLSPRLAYLQNVPAQGGASFIKIGTDSDSINLATLTSPTRRQAYADNTYLPCRYIMIWPRAQLLEKYQ